MPTASSPRVLATVGLVLVAASSLPGAALADSVVNTIASSPGSDTVALGSTTSVGYQVLVQNAPTDPENGCNAKGSSPAVVTIVKPAAVTATPANLTFTGCGLVQNVTFSGSAVGNYTISVTVTDSGAGTYATSGATFTLHVTTPPDTTPPVLTLPSGVTAEATSAAGATVAYNASANDAHDGPVAASCSPTSGSTFPLGNTTVECSAQDAAGNSANGTFVVWVRDTTAPSFAAAPQDVVTAEATGPSGANVTFTSPGATDGVSSASVSCTPASGSLFPLGPTTVTCTATDDAGNQATTTLTVLVEDTTPPAVTPPANLTLEATSPAGATAWFNATATDLVDGSLAPTCAPAAGSTFPLGNTTVECSATDEAGNTGNATFRVTVQDTTAPALQVPDDITQEATGPTGATVWFNATATDAADASPDVQCDATSGGTFPLGNTTVECSATDDQGLSSSDDFLVRVVDTTPPTVHAPANLTLEAVNASGATATFSADATDLVDGALPATCAPDSGTTFPLGSTGVDCSATDTAGNVGHAGFTLRVQDTTAPLLSLPADWTLEATGSGGAAAWFNVSASDAVDAGVAAACDQTSGSTFALGTTEVHCWAEDSAGNNATGTFNVTVEDTTAPTLALPSDATLEATGPDGAAHAFSPTASDVVDGATTVECDAQSGATFPLGTTAVNCWSEDAAHNNASGAFNVTVRDTTPPDLDLPSDITLEATGPSGAAASYDAWANDTVSGARGVHCEPSSGSTFPLGTTPVGCYATDEVGNNATGSFNVTVEDTTAPTLALPSDITAEAQSELGAPVEFSANATDLVDGAFAGACDATSGAFFPLGTTEVHCWAEDEHGNNATGAFNVTVQDTTPPRLYLPLEVVAEAQGPDGGTANWSASAGDLVDGFLGATCDPPQGSLFPFGFTNVTCTATDDAGNTGNGTFQVFVHDTTGPALALPSDITAEATGSDGANVTFAANATDLVDGPTSLWCDATSGQTFPLGTTLVTCASEDTRGNNATGRFNVTVRDTTPPTVTLGGVAHGAAYVFGSVPAATCEATDLVDGPVACVVTGWSGAVGSHAVTATAEDDAGNEANATLTYDVLPWTLSGLFKPVNEGWNPVKAGSTVPLKFRVLANGTELNDTSAVAGILVERLLTCTPGATGVPVALASAGSTLLRWDAAMHQFVFNWKAGAAGACYRVTIVTADGGTMMGLFVAK